MRNRHKTLLRDHSVPEVTLKACPQHAQSQPYLKPSPLEDLKDLPQVPGHGQDTPWTVHLLCSCRRTFLSDLIALPSMTEKRNHFPCCYCPHPKDGGRYCFQFISPHPGGSQVQVQVGGYPVSGPGGPRFRYGSPRSR